jgi:CHAD domain-containing protein
MDEREVKLSAPPGFRLPDLSRVAVDLVPGPPEKRHLDTVYYDTPDLRLARWGTSLRHRAGEGWTVKLPASSDGALLIRPEHTFPGWRARPHPDAVDLLRAYLRTEEPKPVAHLRTVRRVVPLLDGGGHPMAEVADDEVSILEGRRIASRFRELEVEVKEGMRKNAVTAVVDRLQAAGASQPDPTPKYIRALGPAAAGPPEVSVAPLPAESTVADVVRLAVAESVTRLIRHDAGVRLGEDPECVHQARVATRRLRSDLRTFRSFLDPEWNRSLRDELGWLGRLLGEVRDTEVLLARFRARAAGLSEGRAAERLLGRLVGTRETARVALLEALRGDRYVALLNRLVSAAEEPRLAHQEAVSAREALPDILAALWTHLEGAVAEMDDPPTDEQLHRVRIRTKRLRYAAEAAAPALGKRERSLARAASRLQDALGEHQDAVVARAWLIETSRGSGTRQAFAAGELAALEMAAAAATRRAWPLAWKALAKRRPKAR